MKKRSICPRCNYPKPVCVCSHISCLQIPLQLTILQHPLESRHGKNSARLIPLCIEKTEILVGENEHDFAQLKQQISTAKQTTWVLYPNALSLPLEDHQKHYPNVAPERLIVIDATWRKATKIWQLNPWLHTLPSWHFKALPDSQYRIRKSNLAHSLSTLEASAHGLKILLDSDMQPLLKLFDAMQKQQEKYIPARSGQAKGVVN